MTEHRLLARLAEGPVICAEGYLFELERRGYLQAGAFVPEVVLDHPERVTALHEEFVHAGSDVVEAFTYYAHREKLRIIGKDDLLEPLNRQALALAAEVAKSTGTMLAGNVCNTNVYDPADPDTHARVRDMFTEQVSWAVEAGADFVIAETLRYHGEAMIALEVIRETGLPSVVTLVADRSGQSREGLPMVQACQRLVDAGADVVGLNCNRGPWTMLPLLAPLVEAVDVPVAALPVPYRTTADQPTFQSLRDPAFPEPSIPFPVALDPFTCTRHEITEFTRQAADMGVRYLGLCCGAAPHHLRAMAEALGRTPPASRYSADMSKHAYLGTDASLLAKNQQYADQL
ncbi:MAG: homocysteine S-methyltransferase family protein [Kutzneria sp.]|nr:homocysteine S-methyltransferase family protein [Kutzneria sp.]MBV9844283.1 homocysteine S-methyltransferase family protein [Kutzneria sp.]